MVIKVLIPIVIILLVGMVAFVLWPQKKAQQVTSLTSAITDSQEIECDYVDGNGLDTKTYVKNGMLSSQFVDKKNDANSGGIVIKNGNSYLWWTKDKQGFVAAASVDNSESKNQLISDMEKYKDSCKPTAVSDSVFHIPSDVLFRDFFKKKSSVPKTIQE